MNYFDAVNSPAVYGIVALIIVGVSSFSLIFLVKSWKAGLAIGMDRTVLKRAITSSATFTLLPSLSILLGIIALSGSLGVPFPWLRLSVIGAIQYELNVADIAATSIGLSGLRISEMTIQAFSTIALVMTTGILGGVFLSIVGLKKYLEKIRSKPKVQSNGKQDFGTWATIAMFIGLCAAYIGSYLGSWISLGQHMPITVASISAASMAVFSYFIQKKNRHGLENFDLAVSMLIGMLGAVLISGV